MTGETLGERLAADDGAWVDRTIIAERNKPLEPQGGLVALFGNLAPQGAILKRSAADAGCSSTRAGRWCSPRWRISPPASTIPSSTSTPTISSSCKTPARIPPAAMPEAGYLPIPKKLAVQGVKDMVRISDARMSGTAFGTIVLHVTPDAASGGPLGLVRNGDRIRLSVKQRRIALLVDDAELKRRARAGAGAGGTSRARLCPALRAGNPRRRRGLRFRLPQAALRRALPRVN